MVDFKKLRKMSSDSFGNLGKAIEKMSSNSFDKEKENYWTNTVDKEGNGSAIIRFIPAPEWFESEGENEENTYFVRLFEHGFQGPTGKWYIEKSLTTLGQDDPVSLHNSELWNSGIDAKKEIARKQKRKLHYVSNILVIKDPANPENNGKVFLFKYGVKIFNKIKEALTANPDMDEKPVSAFNIFDAGANFKLIQRKVESYPNYDNSKFADPSSLSDEQIEYVSTAVHSLLPIIDPANFKSYEELDKRLNQVLDLSPSRASRKVEREDNPEPDEAPVKEKNPWDTDDADADLEYFKKLAADAE